MAKLLNRIRHWLDHDSGVHGTGGVSAGVVGQNLNEREQWKLQHLQSRLAIVFHKAGLNVGSCIAMNHGRARLLLFVEGVSGAPVFGLPAAFFVDSDSDQVVAAIENFQSERQGPHRIYGRTAGCRPTG